MKVSACRKRAKIKIWCGWWVLKIRHCNPVADVLDTLKGSWMLANLKSSTWPLQPDHDFSRTNKDLALPVPPKPRQHHWSPTLLELILKGENPISKTGKPTQILQIFQRKLTKLLQIPIYISFISPFTCSVSKYRHFVALGPEYRAAVSKHGDVYTPKPVEGGAHHGGRKISQVSKVCRSRFIIGDPFKPWPGYKGANTGVAWCSNKKKGRHGKGEGNTNRRSCKPLALPCSFSK